MLLLMAAARLPYKHCVVQARYGIGDCFLAATPDEAEAFVQEGSLQQSSNFVMRPVTVTCWPMP